MMNEEENVSFEKAHFKRKAAHIKGRMLLGGQVQIKEVDLKQGTNKCDRTQKKQDLA